MELTSDTKTEAARNDINQIFDNMQPNIFD